MMVLSNKIFFAFLLWIIPLSGFCQLPLEYIEKYSMRDGLSSNSISDQVIDPDGYLWIATTNGLERYDGYEFKHYFAGTSQFTPSSGLINRLLLLDSFHLALGTEDGFNILDLKTGVFKKIKFSPPVNSKYESFTIMLNQIKHVEKDINGNIWLGTPVALIRLDSAANTKNIYWSDYSSDDIGKKRLFFVWKIIPVASGDVLFFLNKGNYAWSKKPGSETDTLTTLKPLSGGEYSFLEHTAYTHCFRVKNYLFYLKDGIDSLFVFDEISGRKASCIFPDNRIEFINWRHNLSYLYDGWIALTFDLTGLALIKVNESREYFSITYYNKHYFPNDNFRKIVVDREKNLWSFSTLDGLLKMKYKEQVFKSVTLPPSLKIKDNPMEISSLLRSGKHVFISTRGNGLYKWEPYKNSFAHYTISDSEDKNYYWNNFIWNLRSGNEDTLWMGTHNGLFWYHKEKNRFGRIPGKHSLTLDTVPITTQFTDSRGLVWIGLGKGNGVCQYNPTTHTYKIFTNSAGMYPFRYPVAIAEDSHTNLWFLSDNSESLVRWDRKSGQFFEKPIPFQGVRLKPYYSIFIDKSDGIWMDMESSGLIRYDINSEKIERTGQKNNLWLSYVGGFYQDKMQRIWMASSGLFCFDPSSAGFISYRNWQGAPIENYTSTFYWDSVSGNLFGAAYDKIIYFSPEKLEKTNGNIPVHITSLTVNGREINIPVDRKLHLDWDENTISIRFTGINLTDGDQNRYAYKMANADWIEIGKERQINFASLSPGTYNLRLRTARVGNDWSEVMEQIQLVISPPFTKTIWFYLLCFSGLILLFFLWYRIRTNNYMKMQKLRSHISRDLHDELGSKLTSISYLSMGAQNKNPGNIELLDTLKRINRNSIEVSDSLREIIWGVSPDADNLNQIIPMLISYTAEMLETKNIELNAHEDKIPENLKLEHQQKKDFIMIYKEAIHNILKHSDAGRVEIGFTYRQKILSLSIKDNGNGFETNGQGIGNGLRNMTNRAKANNWEFNICSQLKRGTSIDVKIKITKMWY